ncbi:MAG TPA: glycosyltransferase [Pyrinomonadaceae bacterium]|nr:glycosyltransferase [Pyrinomonadaceae bacterium]
MLRERLRENLSLRLALKRLAFGTLGAAVRLSARAYDFAGRVLESAAANGLDLRRDWGVRPRPPRVEPFGAADFLLLTRAKEESSADRPVSTSVIVTASGGSERTFQSLRSLLREVDFGDAEIIVVDDATTGETRELLSHFGGLARVIRSEEPLGPAGARNRGAAEARGRHLVFLDHDAVVEPGWLRQLVETAERDAGAGAVGSMLLGPEGRLLEAGGVIWRDGELTRYGSGGSPDDRRFSFAREVDYCSGASLLVRRELFESLGGFGPLFAPAGYGGADLCMGLRSLGFKVIYQPLSRAVSHRAETTTAAGREKFCDKWRGALEREHAARGGADEEAAANRKWAAQVVVFDDLIPTPDRDAGSARMMHILRALSEWAHPVFVATGKLARPEYEKLLWREGIETAGALDFKRLLRRRKFRAAVLSRPAVAAAMLGPVRRAAPGLKIVYDMLDVHHLRATREAALTGDERAAREAEKYRRMETRTARAADLIWCGSRNDKEIMERVAPGVPSVVVPTIHELHEPGPPFGARDHLLFVGSFAHRPNVDAVLFMAREVMPLVRESLAGVELLVVGGGAPAEFAEYATRGVRVLGYVPDLVPFVHGCRVFVAPIRFGSGVNGKIGEALSYGLPVVTTTIGAEGWGFTPGEQVLIADGAGDFAEAVVRLYGDAALWQRLAGAGRRHIEENFTREVIGRVINDSLRE